MRLDEKRNRRPVSNFRFLFYFKIVCSAASNFDFDTLFLPNGGGGGKLREMFESLRFSMSGHAWLSPTSFPPTLRCVGGFANALASLDQSRNTQTTLEAQHCFSPGKSNFTIGIQIYQLLSPQHFAGAIFFLYFPAFAGCSR